MADYYVDKTTGDDGDSGLTEALAWETLAKVTASSFVAGDTINLKQGETWAEGLTFPSSGSSGNPITITSYGSGNKPKISNPSGTGIYIQDQNYINIVGINMEACSTSGGIAVGTTGNIDAINWTNCDFYNNGERGLVIGDVEATPSYAQNCTVTNCTMSYNDETGIWIQQAQIILITNCTTHHNCQDGTAQYNAGMKIGDVNRYTNNIIVENCESYKEGYDSEDVKVCHNDAGAGIWFDTVQTSTIRYCKSYDNYNTNLYVENAYQCKLHYSLSYGCGSNVGVDVYASNENYITESCEIYNNVSYNNSTGGLRCRGKEDYTVADTFNNNLIKNNICVDNNSGGNDQEAIFEWGAENASTAKGRGTGNVYKHNCFGTESTYFIEWGDGTYEATYDAWETDYGSSTNSVESDPSFVDATNDDFQLQKNSPCIGAGAHLGLSQDYGGTSVPQGLIPDVGAYEFVPTAWIYEGIKIRIE